MQTILSGGQTYDSSYLILEIYWSGKAEHREAEALAFLQNSVATMDGHIDGLLRAEIGTNTVGGDYDLVFYSELADESALKHSRTTRSTSPTENVAKTLWLIDSAEI